MPWLEGRLSRGDYLAEVEDIGEGLNGEFDEDDPSDVPLLRFTVSCKNSNGLHEAMDDASYCTLLNAHTATQEQVDELLNMALDIVEKNPDNYKKGLEQLSWYPRV